MDPFLFQLADSAFPTGGYAFSGGLEAAWQSGLSGPEVEPWLRSCLDSHARWELPHLAGLWDLPEGFERTWRAYDAQAMAPAARSASVRLGGNWIRVLRRLRPDVSRREEILLRAELPTHQIPVLAALLPEFGVTLAEARTFVLWTFLRDQMSCAVRLGMLGPLEAASVHHGLASRLADLERQVPRTPDLARRTAAAWEIAQLHHDSLYSRLFQS
jgi:urease accessory protein